MPTCLPTSLLACSLDWSSWSCQLSSQRQTPLCCSQVGIPAPKVLISNLPHLFCYFDTGIIHFFFLFGTEKMNSLLRLLPMDRIYPAIDESVRVLQSLDWIGDSTNIIRFNNLLFIPVESLAETLGLEVMLMKVLKCLIIMIVLTFFFSLLSHCIFAFLWLCFCDFCLRQQWNTFSLC